MNKLKQIIEFLKTKCGWRIKEKPNEVLEQFAKFIVDRYSWELEQGTNIPQLLESIRDIKLAWQEKFDNYQKRVQGELNRIDYLEQVVRDNEHIKNRFELEVVHLKDIIQEKNMVIDKLLADLNLFVNKK